MAANKVPYQAAVIEKNGTVTQPWLRFFQSVANQDITINTLTLDNLTPNRLVASDATKTLVSVPNLDTWVHAGVGIIVSDIGDGKIEVSSTGGVFTGFANPTAQIGLTSVNGSATTAMRSDAAPALDQGITPVWTGAHEFANEVRFSTLTASRIMATDGAKNAESVDLEDWIAGTPNQIDVTGTDGAVTLSLPQDIDVAATPTWANAYFTELTTSLPVFTGVSGQLVSNPMTGTGNVVMSNGATLVSPILNGTIATALTPLRTIVTAADGSLSTNTETGTGSHMRAISPTTTGTLTAEVANFDGIVTVGTTSNARNLQIRGPAGTNRQLIFQSGGSNRWLHRITSASETGGDAGSDYTIRAMNDSGSVIDTPLTIVRAAGGAFTISRPVTLSYYAGTGTRLMGASSAGVVTIPSLVDGDYTYTGDIALYSTSANQLVFANASNVLASSASVGWDGSTLAITGSTSYTGDLTTPLTASRIASINGSGVLSVNAALTPNSLNYADGTGSLASLGAATNGQIPIGRTGLAPVMATLTGTANRLSVSNASGSITLDIDSAYVGQNSITTVGTIGTGIWQGTPVGTVYGGTGLSSYTLGDTLYASASNTLATLAGNTTTTRKFLSQTGTGSASAAPVWNALVSGDITAGLGYTPVNRAGDTMTGLLTLSGDPSTNLQAATKQYVDAIAAGLKPKASVACATTANITLSGEQTIDGVATSASRVLVKDQSTASENGIYVSAAGAWARSTDMDADAEIPGALTFVEAGTVNAARQYVVITPSPITLGSTSIEWSIYFAAESIVAGAGLTKTGSTLAVGTASTSRIVVNSDDIDLATSGVSAGTYTKLTVDAYGRATVGANATTSDIAEGSNLYYTNARARAALSGTTNQVNYNSSTGVFSTPQNIHTGATPTFVSMFASGLSTDLPVFTNGSKELISNSKTGTGSVAMSASPTFTGTVLGANSSWSGTLAVAGQSSFLYAVNLGDASITNGVVNSVRSMYFNIDSDNDASGEIFAWGHNAAVTGSTRLMTLADSGLLTLVGLADAATNPRLVGATTTGGLTIPSVIDGNYTYTGNVSFYNTAANQVAFFNGSNVLDSSSAFGWDGSTLTVDGDQEITGSYQSDDLAGTGNRLALSSAAGVLVNNTVVDGDYAWAGDQSLYNSSANQILFADGSNIMRSSANLGWNGSNLSVTGTESVTGSIGVGASASVAAGLNIQAATTTGATQYGIYNTPTVNSSASTGLGIYSKVNTAAGAYTPGVIGSYIDNPGAGAGATIDLAIGLYIADQTAGASDNYAIYSAGGQSYFQDFVTFGGSIEVTSQATIDTLAGTGTRLVGSGPTGTLVTPSSVSGNYTWTGNQTFSGNMTLPSASTNQVLYVDGSGSVQYGSGLVYSGSYLEVTGGLTATGYAYFEKQITVGETLEFDTSTFPVMQVKGDFVRNSATPGTSLAFRVIPHINAGASNANTDLTVFDVNTINDNTTGVTTTLIKASYGNSEKFKVDSSGNVYVQGDQILSTRRTGWSAWTGSASRTSRNTGTADAQVCAYAIKALIDDLMAMGILGA